jgi:very-short-patch-repair endonuclease
MRRDAFLMERARELRRNSNEAERRLWWKLRGHQLSGFKFRRQHPVGPYIADFVCLPARLVIEVDGETHGSDQREAMDARRTDEIERAGYRVIRFWNDEIMTNMEGVLETIFENLYPGRPSP